MRSSLDASWPSSGRARHDRVHDRTDSSSTCTAGTRRSSRVQPRSCASRRRPRRCRPACAVARRARRPVRRPGLGHGLAGGAVPLDGAGRDRHDEDEPGARRSTRRPASRGSSPACSTSTSAAAVAHLGLHFAPDPSSQQSCSIGGNVATNSGGPHCLAYGVTERPRAGRRGGAARRRRSRCSAASTPSPPGYDLRGAFVGGEGTLGIATRIARAPHADPAGGAHAAARLHVASTTAPRR